MRDASEAGGKEYAELCALAYRQSVATHKLVQTPQRRFAVAAAIAAIKGNAGYRETSERPYNMAGLSGGNGKKD